MAANHKVKPSVDPNRILDIAGAWLAECCVTDKPGFEGGRAEAIKCYFIHFSSLSVTTFSSTYLGAFTAVLCIFCPLRGLQAPPSFPSPIPTRPSDETLTILTSLYPFRNNFGDLASPSFPDAVYTDVPVPLQRQVEHEDNKRFHIPIPEFFLDWDSCANNPSKAEEQPEAVKEFKAHYTFEAHPHNFRDLSSAIFLLLMTLLKNGEEPDFSCFSRLMWTLTNVIHHETSNAQELDARPSDPFAQHHQAIFNYFQSLCIMTMVGGDNRSVHTVGCLLNFLSTRHHTIFFDCISSLIATTQSIVISTQRQISFGSSKADEEAVSYSLLRPFLTLHTVPSTNHSSSSFNSASNLKATHHTLPDSPQVPPLSTSDALSSEKGMSPSHDTISSSHAHLDFYTQKSVTEWTAQAEGCAHSDPPNHFGPPTVSSFFLQNNDSLRMTLESPPDPSSEDVEAAKQCLGVSCAGERPTELGIVQFGRRRPAVHHAEEASWKDQTVFSIPTEVVIDDQLPLFRTSWSDTPTVIPRDAVYASSTQPAVTSTRLSAGPCQHSVSCRHIHPLPSILPHHISSQNHVVSSSSSLCR
ncbi:hypothetical protein BLNAU_24975 [Blattamonas nauphoetae]|uniref:Uncharacterized protein n=1 Tax=Blattamonas nauphoetae TaxID=2049346 RepID=A0ABQ9WLA5_9EUKA|nr:hypothetical protein BLNAU_24975 [Blattamonas nauphoetae]